MSGNKAGGKKAAATNKQRYGDLFYQEIGRIGGQNGHTGGFAANRELAATAGRKGGRISRRGKATITTKKIEPHAMKIQDMFEEGYSMAKIAEKLKVPANTLRRWAKENVVGYGYTYGGQQWKK